MEPEELQVQQKEYQSLVVRKRKECVRTSEAKRRKILQNQMDVLKKLLFPENRDTITQSQILAEAIKVNCVLQHYLI